MAAAVDESTPDESIIHDMRITQHGKMNAWVEFALDFLHQNPETGITLHTLPAPKRQTPTEPAVEQPPEPKDSSQAKPDRMPPSMSTIPRLISVAEIIKREYLKTLSSDDAQEGVLTGLHQYNVIGTLPDESPAGAEDPEAERLQAISAALTGKNHLKQPRIAYMKITLSRKCIPELRSKGASYQEPALRRLSKSARTRSRRRRKNQATTEDAEPS